MDNLFCSKLVSVIILLILGYICAHPLSMTYAIGGQRKHQNNNYGYMVPVNTSNKYISQTNNSFGAQPIYMAPIKKVKRISLNLTAASVNGPFSNLHSLMGMVLLADYSFVMTVKQASRNGNSILRNIAAISLVNNIPKLTTLIGVRSMSFVNGVASVTSFFNNIISLAHSHSLGNQAAISIFLSSPLGIKTSVKLIKSGNGTALSIAYLIK